MLLLAGVVDSTTNYIEHPEAVADRLERAAGALGDPHRIIAATDCGFETTAGLAPVAEELVWAKLRAMRAGADLASNGCSDSHSVCACRRAADSCSRPLSS